MSVRSAPTVEELTQRNSGDDDLATFLDPLMKNSTDLKSLTHESLVYALNEGTLVVSGVKLWNALHSDTWRHREAAA